jgi:predicted metal-dependent hydrolase
MSENNALIIAFVNDLFFGSRIDAGVRALGYAIEMIGDPARFGSAEWQDAPGEPVRGGQTTALMLELTAKQPALLIFDLGNTAIPWERWIPVLKTSPATRRLPILCYAPHVLTEQLALAHKLGADQVVTRGRFSDRMGALITEMARQRDEAGLSADCAAPLPDLVRQGIERFNRREFYPAHDDLEAAWVAEKGGVRDLYRAVLQLAIACLQIERGNRRGAQKMFLRLRQWLAPLPDRCQGVDVVQLREMAEALHSALQALPEGETLAAFDWSVFRPIPLT